MITTRIANYINGDYQVTIYSDGTKYRCGPPNGVATFPESIDLKITNMCDGGCSYCHENSVPTGRHADLKVIENILDWMHPGAEVAIGGGNPLSHPDLIEILYMAANNRLIPNITVNHKHLTDDAWVDRLNTARFIRTCIDGKQRKVLYGLGISYDNEESYQYIERVLNPDTIIHLIAGYHSVHSLFNILEEVHYKVLVLGYKKYGRGVIIDDAKVANNLDEWKYWIGSLPLDNQRVICFDNLAVEQLCLEETLPSYVYNRHYLGGDGSHTMYIDAVTQTYAVNSISQRYPINDKSVNQMFAHVKERRLIPCKRQIGAKSRFEC